MVMNTTELNVSANHSVVALVMIKEMSIFGIGDTQSTNKILCACFYEGTIQSTYLNNLLLK